MSHRPESRLVLTAAERKKQLIAESALRRRRLIDAQQDIHAGLQMESLTRSVLGKAAQMAVALVAGKAGIGNRAGLTAWLPLALSGAAALSRNTALKPVLRQAVLATAFGALAAAFARKALAAHRSKRSPR